ncbi:unnamed protein product [Amoebophrya sp. A25]|nr:unnamed protein product [Amoebophrya sp. A25]|eukprot:GSA25T00002786001.1
MDYLYAATTRTDRLISLWYRALFLNLRQVVFKTNTNPTATSTSCIKNSCTNQRITTMPPSASRQLLRISPSCSFARPPGRGFRIQSPLSNQNLLCRSGGWKWLSEWQTELEAVQEKAVKIRRKVPWDGTNPEILTIKAERKEFLRNEWKKKKAGGGG